MKKVILKHCLVEDLQINCILSVCLSACLSFLDLSGTPSINVPEQNKMFSVPTLSSPPPPQEYLPRNLF